MDGLTWVMELLDRTSGPARRVASALDGVRVAQDRVRAASGRAARAPDPLGALERATSQRRGRRQAAVGRELEQLARSQRQGATESSAFSGSLSGVGSVLLGVAAAAIGAAVAIGGVGISASRSAVELAGFQESTMVSMQTMLGSRGAAETEFDSAIRIARATPFDTRNVVSMRRQLIGAGLRDTGERDVMTGVIADLSALNPEDSTVMQRLGLAIGQIRGAGRLRGQELNQLVQAGLSREALFGAIGNAMHLRGTPVAVNRQVASLMEQGRITDQIAFAAMARAVMQMTNTTSVGQFAANQSTTIPGLLSTLGSAVPELLLGRGADGTRLFESKGMVEFKKLLQGIIELFSSGSPTGQRLQGVLRGLVDSVFGLLRGVNEDPKAMTVMFHRAITAVEGTIRAVSTLWKWGQAFAGGYLTVVGPLFEKIGQVAGWVMSKIGGTDSERAQDALRGIGILIGLIVAPLLVLSAVAVAVFGAIAYAIGWAFGSIGEEVTRAADEFEDFKRQIVGLWDAIPEPLRWLLANGTAPGLVLQGLATISGELGDTPASSLAGANRVVTAQAGAPGLRPVVSQPNVTVNVNAVGAAAQDPQGIAAAAAGVLPGIVQESATRATR